MSSKWYMLELSDFLGDGHTFKTYIDSYALTEPQGGHGSSGGAGTVSFHNVDITRRQDKYSAVFRNVSMDGRGFAQMTLTMMAFENGSMINRVVLTFTDVMLETYLPQHGGFSRGPSEKLTFNFEKMTLGS